MSALARVSERINAVPKDEKTENFNYVTTMPVLAAGWNYLLLNGIQIGTGGSNRVGREVFLEKLDFSISGTPTRWMIVYDRQSNGATPATDALTQDVSDSISPQNFSNKERFDILWDSQYDRTPEQAQIYNHKDFEIGLCTYYNSGSAGTVADITSGALYLAVWSVGAAAAPGVSIMLYFLE